MKIPNRQTILVLTPTFTGGSWNVVDDLLKGAKKEFNIYIICLGLGPYKPNNNYKFLSIPYFRLDQLPNRWGSNFVFNLLFQIPIILSSVFAYFWFRPKIIISNGFTCTLGVLTIAKLFNTKVFVYFGSYLERAKSNFILNSLIKLLNCLIEHAYVNSKGSLIDLSHFIDANKITIIEHWTIPDVLVINRRNDIRKNLGLEHMFLVLFLGKRSTEKGCDILLKAINLLKENKQILFWFVGPDGDCSTEVNELCNSYTNIKNFGFIRDDHRVNELVTAADVVWSFADETYLARPAIEALSYGTPIIIPDRPAIPEKWEQTKIPDVLVPNDIGWIIDSKKPELSMELIKKLSHTKVTESMRENCLEYSKEHYSYRNILDSIKRFRKYL